MFEGFTGMFSTDDTDAEGEAGDRPDGDGDPDGQWEFTDEADLAEAAPTGGDAPAADGADGGDDAPTVDELDVRLADLEADLETTESSLRAIRNSQSEMADSVEEMGDTVRQLVGMYDRLAAAENPFVEGPDGTGATTPTADGDGATAAPDGAGARNGHAATDDGVVTFADLRDGDPDAVAGDGVDGSLGDDAAGDEAAANAPEREAEAARETDTDGRGPARAPDEAADPLLTSVPEGYAGDVLVMEWLSALMATAGPAGALRAVEHYEDVGWIAPEVAAHLVDVVGGPSLDVFVDPMQPREPTAEQHADSHGYVRVLSRLDDS